VCIGNYSLLSAFCGAAAFKLIGQGLFYIQRFYAQVFCIAFLLTTHALIAVAAPDPRPGKAVHRNRADDWEADAGLAFIRGFAGILAVATAINILIRFLDYQDHYHGIKSEYYTFAAARALIPYLFWTTIKGYSWILNKSTGKADVGREAEGDT